MMESFEERIPFKSLETLPASKLGTLSYWESVYSTELTNFKDFKDIGNIWFGLDPTERMLDYIEENIAKDCRVLDIGTGNGHLVFGLIDLGFTSVAGLDYSQYSIDLCKAIAADKNDAASVFFTFDFLTNTLSEKYDLMMDKGTFDAISLSKHDETYQPTQIYIDRVYESLNPSGLIIITSCNWTREELLTKFGDRFCLHFEVKYPSFKFGGVEGSKVRTLVLKRSEP